MCNTTDDPYFGGCVPDPYDPNQGNDLILGRPKEVQCVCNDGFDKNGPLQLAAGLEGHSHPC